MKLLEENFHVLQDLTGYKMDDDALKDVCDVHIVPTFSPRSCLLIATVWIPSL